MVFTVLPSPPTIPPRPSTRNPTLSSLYIHSGFFRFNLQVRVAKNLNVILAERFGNELSDAYIVKIGHDLNSKSYIKLDIADDATAGVSFETPEILSASEYRTFWISWSDGLVAFGTGKRARKLKYIYSTCVLRLVRLINDLIGLQVRTLDET